MITKINSIFNKVFKDGLSSEDIIKELEARYDESILYVTENSASERDKRIGKNVADVCFANKIYSKVGIDAYKKYIEDKFTIEAVEKNVLALRDQTDVAKQKIKTTHNG